MTIFDELQSKLLGPPERLFKMISSILELLHQPVQISFVSCFLNRLLMALHLYHKNYYVNLAIFTQSWKLKCILWPFQLIDHYICNEIICGFDTNTQVLKMKDKNEKNKDELVIFQEAINCFGLTLWGENNIRLVNFLLRNEIWETTSIPENWQVYNKMTF